MKRLTFTTLMGSLLLLFVAAMPHERKTEKQKKEQIMEMMKDSTTMNMLIDHIASDEHIRVMMMHRMVKTVRSNKSEMMELHNAMMKDKDMHALMTKMMGGEMPAVDRATREILVKFKPGVEQAQVKAMEMEKGLQRIKDIPELNVKVFRITSSRSIKEVIEHCQKRPIVEYAEPNLMYKTHK